MTGMTKLYVFVFSVLAFACVVPAGLTACTQQPVFPTSAIAAAETAAQTATTVVNDAQAAWPIVKSFLPLVDQDAAQDAFDKGVFAVNHSILALDDAIGAAIKANIPNPDFSALLSSLGDAVSQIVAVVQEFQVKAPAASVKMRAMPDSVDAFSDMQLAASKLKVSK